MNSRLTIAAHVLGLIAARSTSGGEPITSAELAASVGTNPVVVRRVVGMLQDAGLVESRRGAGGGTVLARPAGEIDLRQVYVAVAEDEVCVLGRHPGAVGASCPVAPAIASYLDEVYGEAELRMLERLEAVDVETLAREVLARIDAPRPVGGAR